ncbi:cyd operon protein YbgE [Escherichia coli]
MSKIIATLYAVMDKRPLRALSFVMALLFSRMYVLGPISFAAKTSELEIWHGLLLMWAVCAGVIHGVGFRPQKVPRQGIFCPLLADIVLIVGLIFFFFKSEFSLKLWALPGP